MHQLKGAPVLVVNEIFNQPWSRLIIALITRVGDTSTISNQLFSIWSDADKADFRHKRRSIADSMDSIVVMRVPNS